MLYFLCYKELKYYALYKIISRYALLKKISTGCVNHRIYIARADY